MKVKGVVAVLMVVSLVFVFASGLMAEEKKSGLEVRDSDTVSDFLIRHSGKRVELRLDSGETIGGKLVLVTQHLVHLAEITGKSFYDAVIRKVRISAVIIRVRGN